MRHFSKGGRLFAFLLAVLMMVSAIPVVAFAEEATPTTQSTADRIKAGAFKASGSYHIAMLDCGRKYFTVTQIKKLIDYLSKDGYNQLQLSFGNGGFRFLLDDMSISYNGLELSDEVVRGYIADGNEAWISDDETCLTQSEMDEILLYAGKRSIEIVPMLNIPAHCEGLVAGSPYGVEIKNQWGTQTWNLDVTSEAAKNYGYGMLKKYVTYFAARGVRFFNFGADEAKVSSVVTGSVDASDFNAAIATFAAGAAELIQEVGMTPRCFNDVFMSGNDAALTRLKNAGTQVCYWEQTLGMSANEIAELGFELINTNSNWYYVTHSKSGSVAYGDGMIKLPSVTNDGKWPDLDQFCVSAGNTTLSKSDKNVGSMFCLWFDYPDLCTGDYLLNESQIYSGLWQLEHMADIYWPSDVKPSLPTDAPSTDATESETEAPVVKPEGATETVVNVTLKPGETWTSDTYGWKGGLVTGEGDRAIAEATVSSGTRNEAASLTRKDPAFSADETHLIGDGTNWLCVNADGSLYNTTDASKATKWVISGSKSSYVIFSNGYYLTYTRSADSYSLSTSKTLSSNTDDGKYNSTGKTIRWQYGSYGVYGTLWNSQWGTERTPYLRCVSGTWEIFEASLASNVGKSSATYTYDYDPGYVGDYATVSFEGMGVPSTLTTTYYLTNGTDQVVKFNVTVEPETLDATKTQDVEMFLTSHWVGEKVVTPDTVGEHIKTLKPAQAYGKYGVSLSSLVLRKGVDEDSHEVWYWKGTKLTEENKQGSNAHVSEFGGNNDDRTGKGIDFMYIRYWQGKWEILSTADGNWKSIGSTEQLVAYYMQVQVISPEITTTFRDYGRIAGTYYDDMNVSGGVGGYPGQENVSYADGFYGVGSAVVYPGRVLSHTEQEIWDETLVLFYDHLVTPLRSPGVMKAYDTENFRVTKITITHGHHVINGQTADNDAWKTTKVWNGNDSVAWEKTGVAGEEWYDEKTLWTRKDGEDYSEGILLDEDLLSQYAVQPNIVGEAWLLLFYVEPVAKAENLKVVYYDDINHTVIKDDIQIGVTAGNTYFNALNNDGSTTHTAGKIDLKDDAYIINSVDQPQGFNKKLSQLENIDAMYKTGDYYYVGADISEDGKTLTLHYSLKNTLKVQYYYDAPDGSSTLIDLDSDYLIYVTNDRLFTNGIQKNGGAAAAYTAAQLTADIKAGGNTFSILGMTEQKEDVDEVAVPIYTALAQVKDRINKDAAYDDFRNHADKYLFVKATYSNDGAILQLHYVKNVDLKVVYVDDVTGDEIATDPDFATTDGETFKDSYDKDDTITITDKDGNEQTVEKDLSKLPDDILPDDKKEQYKDHYVDRIEVDDDGETLIIYYKAKTTLTVNYYDKTQNNKLIISLPTTDAPVGSAWTNTDGVWSAPTLTGTRTAELLLSSVPGVVAPYNVVGRYVLVAADTTTTDEGRTLNLYYRLATTTVTVKWWDDKDDEQISSKDFIIYDDTTLKDSLTDVTVGESGKVTLGEDPTLTDYENTKNPIIQDLLKLVDEEIDAKYKSGLYEYIEADLSEDGKTLTLHYTLKTFDKSVSYVLDYGLPVKINDLKGLFNEFYGIDEDQIQIIYADGDYLQYANMLWDDDDWNQLTYKLNRIMNGVDSIILTAYVTDEQISATLTLMFIPATNIYYENSFDDEFLDTKDGGYDLLGDGNHTEIKWETIGTTADLLQSADRVGSRNPYGYDDAYATGLGLSAGSALKVTVPYGTKLADCPTLSFTFTGTGFDIISRTGADQGRIGVTIKQGNTVVKEYGVINRGDNELYQVPVMSVEGLEHGTYDVTITVYPPMQMTNRETGEKKYLYGTAQGATFVLDGIRIYDPVDTTDEENSEVLEAYKADGQAVVKRVELRDLLINAGNDMTTNVDKGEGGSEADLNSFTSIGPNNEVYLAPGQSITFTITLNEGEVLYFRSHALLGKATGTSIFIDKDVQIPTSFTWDYSAELTSGEICGWETLTFTYTNTSTDAISGWIALTDLVITKPASAFFD